MLIFHYRSVGLIRERFLYIFSLGKLLLRRVSDLLFKANSAIVQLYHEENKLILIEMMMSWIFIALAEPIILYTYSTIISIFM